jgi:hypothetical protein
MAKKPTKIPEDAQIERTVHIPGWAYNFMIDYAAAERRDVKTELSLVIERAVRELMQSQSHKKDQEPGNISALPVAV